MAKFTFKKTIHVGRYRSFEKDHTVIKLQKKEVGYIQQIDGYKYKIRFAIKKDSTKKNPAPFKWVKIKRIFDNENSARDWIKENENLIQRSLDLYQFEN